MFPTFKRNKYFSGKLMSEQDFQDEQGYFREKTQAPQPVFTRLRSGDGAGGCRPPDDSPGMVRVEPGYAFHRMGDDILLPEAPPLPFLSGQEGVPDHRNGRSGIPISCPCAAAR